MKNNLLLLGGSGTLGKAIINSKLFKNLNYPSSKRLNILLKNKVENFILKNKIDIVIHCAALARVKECEKNKKKAFKINVTGTKNIVEAILNCSKKTGKKIKLIFISTDGVYPSTRGNYKENDILKPYNYYGWTKLRGEKLVKKLDEYIIIRTRFFNKKKIKFKYSATNIYTSALEVGIFVKYLDKVLKKKFRGILNIGGKKISDYDRYYKYNKKIVPCDKNKVFKSLNFKIATDASLNLKKLNRLI